MIFVLSATLLFFLFKKLDIQNCMRGDQHALKDDWFFWSLTSKVRGAGSWFWCCRGGGQRSRQASANNAPVFPMLGRLMHIMLQQHHSRLTLQALFVDFSHRFIRQNGVAKKQENRGFGGRKASFAPPRLTCNWGVHIRNDGKKQSNCQSNNHSIIGGRACPAGGSKVGFFWAEAKTQLALSFSIVLSYPFCEWCVLAFSREFQFHCALTFADYWYSWTMRLFSFARESIHCNKVP